MKPLLAHTYKDAYKKLTFPCFVQPKLNGVRALWQPGKGFYSRDEIPWYSEKLRHIETWLNKIFGRTTLILDGELYVHGWSLQRINSAVAVNSRIPTDDTFGIQYHIFDCVDYNLSFINRYTGLSKFEYLGTPISKVPTYHCESQELGDTIYQQVVAKGYEGCMYRLGDCPYTRPKQIAPDGKYLSNKDNRSWQLIKRKEWQDDEFLIVGVAQGKVTDKGGKYRDTLGAFELSTKGGQHFTAAPAMTDSERNFFWTNPPIGKLATVRYLVLSDTGIPLNPRVIAIRENV